VELPEEKAHFIREVRDELTHRLSGRVASLGIVMEEDRPVRPGRRLEQSAHFARVQGVDARVAIPCYEKHRRIFPARHHVLVGRVSIEAFELLGVIGRAVFRNPILRDQEFLITHHVEQRIAADYSLKQVGALGQGGSDQQPAIASARNRQPRGVRVSLLNQPLGG